MQRKDIRNRWLVRLVLAVVTLSVLGSAVAVAGGIVFRDVQSGQELDLSKAKDGPTTEAVETFLETGRNIYNYDDDAIRAGAEHYQASCSGCHGNNAEGKLGPDLADDYWTYRQGLTDKGLFEIIFGGARAMMGPQYNQMSIDEMLKAMAFLRKIYKGDPAKARWLEPDEREDFEFLTPEEVRSGG